MWLCWSSFVGILIPVAIILIIWTIMAHHFATQRTNRSQPKDISEFTVYTAVPPFSLLKRGTLKMVFITALFLLTSAPLCVEYIMYAWVIKNILSSTFWYELSSEDTKVHAEFRPCVHVRLLEQHDPAHHLHRHCHRDQGSFSQVGPIYFLGFNDIADFFFQRTTIFDLSTIHMFT